MENGRGWRSTSRASRRRTSLSSRWPVPKQPTSPPQPQPGRRGSAGSKRPACRPRPRLSDALVADPPWPAGALAFRTAPDEVLVTATPDFEVAGDPHAIVERETAFSYVWLDEATAKRFLDRECEWRRPDASPALAQGEVAGIPAKLWFEAGRTLVLTPAPFAGRLPAPTDRLAR